MKKETIDPDKYVDSIVYLARHNQQFKLTTENEMYWIARVIQLEDEIKKLKASNVKRGVCLGRLKKKFKK